mgnify:CR=1 FL=1
MGNVGVRACAEFFGNCRVCREVVSRGFATARQRGKQMVLLQGCGFLEPSTLDPSAYLPRSWGEGIFERDHNRGHKSFILESSYGF